MRNHILIVLNLHEGILTDQSENLKAMSNATQTQDMMVQGHGMKAKGQVLEK